MRAGLILVFLIPAGKNKEPSKVRFYYWKRKPESPGSVEPGSCGRGEIGGTERKFCDDVRDLVARRAGGGGAKIAARRGPTQIQRDSDLPSDAAGTSSERNPTDPRYR